MNSHKEKCWRPRQRYTEIDMKYEHMETTGNGSRRQPFTSFQEEKGKFSSFKGTKVFQLSMEAWQGVPVLQKQRQGSASLSKFRKMPRNPKTQANSEIQSVQDEVKSQSTHLGIRDIVWIRSKMRKG